MSKKTKHKITLRSRLGWAIFSTANLHKTSPNLHKNVSPRNLYIMTLPPFIWKLIIKIACHQFFLYIRILSISVAWITNTLQLFDGYHNCLTKCLEKMNEGNPIWEMTHSNVHRRKTLQLTHLDQHVLYLHLLSISLKQKNQPIG